MATITEDYVSFETAKLLKDKGFDEPCIAYWFHMINAEPIFNDNMPRQVYNNKSDTIEIIGCPTLQMAMKWLREVHNVNIDIVSVWNQKRFEYQVFVVTPENAKNCYVDYKLYISYSEAVEAAIKYCLENLI